jgi:DNA-binding XRE family transcriptional regulator
MTTRPSPGAGNAARAIGCSPLTFLHWEKGRVAPDVGCWPAILAFLGYDPRPEPAGFGGRIRAPREAGGLSHREAARRLEIDPGTLAAWERGEMSPGYSRTWWSSSDGSPGTAGRSLARSPGAMRRAAWIER